MNNFCVAPWFMIRNENNGTFKPCAVADYDPEYNIREHTVDEWRNSPFLTKLRKDLDNGKPSVCDVCWKAEEIGIRSQRQIINDILYEGKETADWIEMYLKHKQDYKADLTLISEIKVGNNCNLQCAMCHPWDSSKIYTEWKNNPSEFTNNDPEYYKEIRATYKEDKNYLKDILKHPVTFLKILGGEPLLDKRILTELKALPIKRKNKIRLCFVTNGTFNMVEYAKQLQDFKGIYFSVSVDGFGSMNDYIRKNSSWGEILKNILEIKESGLAVPSLSITIQALNIFSVEELFKLAKHYNIHTELGWVSSPDYLSLNALPKHILSQVNTSNKAVQSAIDNAVYDDKLYKKFLRYIKWYERNNKFNMKLSYIEERFYSQKSPT